MAKNDIKFGISTRVHQSYPEVQLFIRKCAALKFFIALGRTNSFPLRVRFFFCSVYCTLFLWALVCILSFGRGANDFIATNEKNFRKQISIIFMQPLFLDLWLILAFVFFFLLIEFSE